MERALWALEELLGVDQRADVAAFRVADSTGAALFALVQEGTGPFVELVVLLDRAVQCAARGGDDAAMAAVAATTSISGLWDQHTSSSGQPPGLDEFLRQIHCPPMSEMLTGPVLAPTLLALAGDWAFQLRARERRCMGRAYAAAEATVNPWLPERAPRGALCGPEQQEGSLCPEVLGAMSSPELRGSWKLVGVDPEYYFVDEPPIAALDIPTLINSLQALHKGTPLLASITGQALIAGVAGSLCTKVWPDYSHLGLAYRHSGHLAPLPRSYNELYHRSKFLYGEKRRATVVPLAPSQESCFTLEEPAVCLVCGQVVMAGNRLHATEPSVTNPGECTLHARSCGLGQGIFFLLQKHSVILIRAERAAFWPKKSIYLDSNGECGVDGGCRPLFLDERRHRILHEIWVRGEVSREVARIRAPGEKIIKGNYY